MKGYGTSYFVSFAKAVRYYQTYGENAVTVARKKDAGEIHIGKPKLKPGQVLRVTDNGTRYAIFEGEE